MDVDILLFRNTLRNYCLSIDTGDEFHSNIQVQTIRIDPGVPPHQSRRVGRSQVMSLQTQPQVEPIFCCNAGICNNARSPGDSHPSYWRLPISFARVVHHTGRHCPCQVLNRTSRDMKVRCGRVCQGA